jgi:hypothetical protein
VADNLKKTRKQGDQRINVDQDHEPSYWSAKLVRDSFVRRSKFAAAWPESSYAAPNSPLYAYEAAAKLKRAHV